MSWEAQAWAARQKCGSSSAKLVLLGLASCAGADHCAYPSVAWLCEFGDLNRKTVIAALQRLEEGMFPLIVDTGERKGRTKQIKVYRLASAEVENAHVDRETETVPKAEQSQKRNSSDLTRKQSQKRDTEPFKEPKPLVPPKGGTFPAPGSGRSGRRRKTGERLPEDWAPPPIDDLSASAIKLVRQWPSGAFEAVCEVFRLHYTAESGPSAYQADWNTVLSKWVMKDHAKIMRDAKAGVSFAALAPPAPQKAKAKPVRILSKRLEDERSARVHEILRRQLGAQIYETWIGPIAILFEGDRLNIKVGSEFARDWIGDRFGDRLGAAAREAGASSIRTVTVEVDGV